MVLLLPSGGTWHMARITERFTDLKWLQTLQTSAYAKRAQGQLVLFTRLL
jgi:hypothetical protein